MAFDQIDNVTSDVNTAMGDNGGIVVLLGNLEERLSLGSSLFLVSLASPRTGCDDPPIGAYI
jgi:hypothetical protein